jgi:metal-sulfur cluster biosynthetic enzyme
VIAPADQLADRATRAAVWASLGTVRDPELDEPVTDLGFVRSCTVRDHHARVRLRLPTAFCAPNFAYLMTADAYDAVKAVPGVHSVDVQLEDHHDSEQINAGVAAQAGFVGTYGEEAAAELDELRLVFRRKAHLACLDRVCRGLTARGWTVDSLNTATLSDLSASERAQLCRRRADLGLSTQPGSLVLVDDTGTPVPPEKVSVTLRFASTVRVSLDGNAHFCRGLLRTRYPGSGRDQCPRDDEQEVMK